MFEVICSNFIASKIKKEKIAIMRKSLKQAFLRREAINFKNLEKNLIAIKRCLEVISVIFLNF